MSDKIESKIHMMIDPSTITIVALCESKKIILYPDILYRFIVMPNCDECEKLVSVCNK